MALVDGRLDVPAAPCLDMRGDVEANYLTELVRRHRPPAVGDRRCTGATSTTLMISPSATAAVAKAPLEWLMPYGGTVPTALAARYEALGGLPDGLRQRRFVVIRQTNGYAFPGRPAAQRRLRYRHARRHVLSASTPACAARSWCRPSPAGIRPVNLMSDHILPVLFNEPRYQQLTLPARAPAPLTPDEFWHAWALGG